jgi:hypothetical protein
MRIASDYRVIPITKALQRAANANKDAILNYTSNLEINGIFFRDEKQKMLMISIDTLYIGADFRDRLEAAFWPRLKSEEIFIAASHTHAAPALDFSKPQLGAVDQHYFDKVLEITLDITEKLMREENQYSCQYRIIRYESSAGINRRKFRIIGGAEKQIKFNQIFQIPNSKELLSQPSYVIEFFTSNSKSIFIWNLPCHPTSIPNELGHSSGFIGNGRELIRSLYSKDSVIIFLQGPSGDIRPPSLPTNFSLINFIRRLLLGNWFTDFSVKNYDQWIAKILEQLSTQMRDLKSIELKNISSFQVVRHTKPYSEFMKISSLNRKLSIHIIKINKFSIFGFSGELLSAFSKYFDTKYKDNVLLATCIDDTFGYLPDFDSIHKRGYEVDGFRKYFDITELEDESYFRMIEWIHSSAELNEKSNL